MASGLRVSDLVEIAERRRRRHPQGQRSVLFCSSCGDVVKRAGQRRVCPECGMGVLLRTAPEALPGPRAAFLVVDRHLRVTAVSLAGERVFGERAPGRAVASLLQARRGNSELGRHVARAASGLNGTARLEVSVTGRRGMFEARISPCGPPRAALVAVARP
jgi:hypothetical protein